MLNLSEPFLQTERYNVLIYGEAWRSIVSEAFMTPADGQPVD